MMRLHLSRLLGLAVLLLTPSALGAPDSAASTDEIKPPTPKKPEPAPAATAPAAGAPAIPPPEKPSPMWDFSVFGYVRLGYDFTTKDPNYNFVGRNNGFVLDSARVGIQGYNADYNFVFRVSAEGAADIHTTVNSPQGSLSVRLRDAFARWDPVSFLGVQAGQFKAPWQAEELRGVPDLMFASRAVGVDGVPAGRGFETPGIQLDRQVGIMLSPASPIGTGAFGVNYYLMVMNGAGANQFLDDNGKVGLVARTEFSFAPYVKLGAGLFRNDRTVGTLPNLYDEEDLGLTGDLDVKVAGAEIFGAITRLRTVFPTVGTSARVQLAYHAQAAYRFDIANRFFLAPGYRFATFDPWQEGGGDGFNAYKLVYHTFGVRLGHLKLPLQGWINYTITGEEPGRKLSNDRLEILGQVTF